MKLFLDSAQVDEIRLALENWDIDGLTTNPRHVQASGKPFLRGIREIAGLFEGTDKPVSVEVNPHLIDWREIVEQGVKLAAISPNFVIKVAVSRDGCRAVRELASRGIRTNVTLVFNATQAWLAARSGATYVSPFVGWKEAQGDDAKLLVGEIAGLLQTHGYPTQVLAAAIRNGRQLAEAAMAGAHCVTAGFAVIEEAFQNPYTTLGNSIFGAAWDATEADRGRDDV